MFFTILSSHVTNRPSHCITCSKRQSSLCLSTSFNLSKTRVISFSVHKQTSMHAHTHTNTHTHMHRQEIADSMWENVSVRTCIDLLSKSEPHHTVSWRKLSQSDVSLCFVCVWHVLITHKYTHGHCRLNALLLKIARGCEC